MKAADLTLLLEHAHRAVSRELGRVLAEEGATAEQWRVLERLSDENGRPMGDLSQHLDMNPPTMTKLIDRMVAAGWVHRVADADDQRRVLVYITDRGLVHYRRLSQRAKHFHGDMASTLGAADMERLGKLLGQLVDRQG